MAKQNILTRSKKLKAAECYSKGQWQEADALYQSVCKLDPVDVGSWVVRAELNRELGRFEEAESYCRRALALEPGFALAHLELGNTLMSQGKPDFAVAAYRKAIQLQPDFPEAHYNLANVFREMGSLDKAAEHYRVAVELRPNFVQALNNLGPVLTTLGLNAEAAKVLSKAHAMLPDSPEILSNIGDLLRQDQRRHEAIEKYEHALKLAPNHLEAISGLADVLEHANRFDEARVMVDRGLALRPDNAALQIVAASLDRRDGRYGEAAGRLETLLEKQPDSPEMGPAYMLLGQVYDRLDKPEMAFAAFSKGNALAAEFEKTVFRNLPSYQDHVRRMRGYLDADFGDCAPTSFAETGVPPPIFLMGFMRSGTTLIEQVLDSHPALRALEEKPTVGTMVKAFEEMAQGRANALADLTEDEVATLRRIYFEEAARHVDIRPGAILMDKMPLNTAHAHIIWRVFPDAKFILAIRHPCDVCLSSFMQNFRINEATSIFLDLEEGAKTYAEVMNVWRKAVQTLPIQYHRIRYEDLVANFEQEVRALLDFLGLEWRDEVLGYAERALKRGNVHTASYHQVTQPIYQHAKYRWRRYAAQMSSVMSTLEPYIDYYGYAEPSVAAT
jgi:tetratricopeptide (TPR) repeat protein